MPGIFRVNSNLKCASNTGGWQSSEENSKTKNLIQGVKELKLFRFFHRHGHHLRCTVGQQTRTSPSCPTTTACSARSRRPTGRRAIPSSSVTPSPLAPQTPSGLSWSSFFLPVRGKKYAQKDCDAKYIERLLGEIGQGYLILAQMLIKRLHRVYAVKILLQVMWTICHNLCGESSQMLFLTCHFNKQPIYLSITTTQNDYFWAFCTWINLSMYNYISLFWKFNFAALEFPLTRSASRPTRFHLGRSQQRRLEVIL